MIKREQCHSNRFGNFDVNFVYNQRNNPCHATGLFLYALKTFPSITTSGLICSLKSIDYVLYDGNIPAPISVIETSVFVVGFEQGFVYWANITVLEKDCSI